MLQNRNRYNDKNVYRKNPTGKLKLKIQRVKKMKPEDVTE